MRRPVSFEDLPLVMTIEDVAEVLQISKSTTYQLARSEQLRCIHVGQRLRVLRTDFITYLTSGIPYPECQPCLAELPLLLTVSDLQPILQLGKNSVLELIHTEQIRCIRVSRQIRVLKHELQLFLLGGQDSYKNSLLHPLSGEYDACTSLDHAEGGI
ncbi:helix-turn-helix domain-containing protein [Flavonifractor sp. An306]|uniref:helix-turn-helix domain-containing protein n=1 Tax=Flavonifractor sp. An306 TaxID=1965629 RepID=UPI000B3742BA|nr:helix-turn-helix domain-containing protein [Flavonifractor sp. An306]OUO42151.1 hypothetical protein B5F88_05055 [Flavonifractor sp. An306]